MTLDVTVYRMSLDVCQKLTKDTRTFNYIKFEPLLLFYCVCTTVIFLWILLYHRKQFTCDLDNILLFSINTEVDVPSSGTITIAISSSLTVMVVLHVGAVTVVLLSGIVAVVLPSSTATVGLFIFLCRYHSSVSLYRYDSSIFLYYHSGSSSSFW